VHPQDPVAVGLAEVLDARAGRFEDPQAEESEQGHEGESLTFWDVRPAASMASNCKWLRPRVGDSGGTGGRRTWSAGE
jgi:hypothetical protein